MRSNKNHIEYVIYSNFKTENRNLVYFKIEYRNVCIVKVFDSFASKEFVSIC